MTDKLNNDIKKLTKEIESDIEQYHNLYKLISVKRKSLDKLLREKYGQDSLLTQIKMSSMEYNMLPEWLRIYRNKRE